MSPNLEACQQVNLILAYAILREREDAIHLLGSLIGSVSGWLFMPELVTANCVKKNQNNSLLLEGIVNVGEKSLTFQGN